MHRNAGLSKRWAAIAVLALWLTAPLRVSWGQEDAQLPDAPLVRSSEVGGTGQATVVAGNEVSARRRALDLARRNAISAAVAVILAPQQLSTLTAKLSPATLSARILRRYALYIRSYRVLEELREGGHFRVAIAAVINSAQLKMDLERLIKSTGVGAAEGWKAKPTRGVRLTVRGDSSGCASDWIASFTRRVSHRLSAGGYSVWGGSLAPGARSERTVTLLIQVDVAQVDGVRGLGLAGVKAVGEYRLTRAGERRSAAVEARETNWETGVALQTACDRAVERCIASVSDRAMAALQRYWPARALPPGQILRLSGMRNFSQTSAVESYLRRKVPGVQKVSIVRFSAQDVWLKVNGEVGFQSLLQLLIGREFQPPCAATRKTVHSTADLGLQLCGSFRLQVATGATGVSDGQVSGPGDVMWLAVR